MIMKRLSFVLTVILLFHSFAFLAAQETEEDALITETAEPAEVDQTAEQVNETEEILEKTELAIESAAIRMLDNLNLLQRLAVALAIIAGQILMIRLVWFLFKRLDSKLENSTKQKIKPLIIRKFTVLTAKQVVQVIVYLLNIIKYFITAVQLFITLPIVFSLFPATRELAHTLFFYILNPLKDIAVGAFMYIPNLFKILIFVIITRYSLKGLKYLAVKIEKGKLIIPNFYTEWAAPTYRILQVLLWAFTIAIIYPYLPGSDSRAFQGVSVFIGVIFSIGSTSAIGNLVAGFVITYMRPFKIGDRVKINDLTGFVVEKNLMVVRLKTHKNEYVTFPNLTILNSSTINYNTSSDEDEEGLILFAEVTFGYSTPWQTVHDILINAALATSHIQKKPKPFVLQTRLDDFYACYQINCYTKDVSKVPLIYTLLYENIQNGFREAGLDMTSAHYRVITNASGNVE